MKDNLIGKTRALDVGSGSGYFTTLMSKMMGNGFVYGVEHIKELSNTAVKNM